MVLDQSHQLYKFYYAVDWDYLELQLDRFLVNTDRKQNNFMAALFYLKTMGNYSVEDAIRQWLDCPYWRFFCGGEDDILRQDFPYSPHLLGIWERELGEEGYEAMIRALLRPVLAKL